MASLVDVCADFEGARVTQARATKGLSCNEIAKTLRVPAYRVQQWEFGVCSPYPFELERLADLLGYPPAFFRRGRPFARLDSAAVHWCDGSVPVT